MHRSTAVLRKARQSGGKVIDTITLDREQRYRRRVLLTTDGGRELMLDLPEATYLADGDGLAVDGGVVLVVAAPEPLLEVHAADATGLARIAWHIGNRHTPAEITPTALYIQPDHVLEEMVTGLGGHVHRVMRPFEPEGGAYGGHGPLHKGHHHGGHDHGHGAHSHGHDHHHTHTHTHAHRVAHGGIPTSRPRTGGKG